MWHEIKIVIGKFQFLSLKKHIMVFGKLILNYYDLAIIMTVDILFQLLLY